MKNSPSSLVLKGTQTPRQTNESIIQESTMPSSNTSRGSHSSSASSSHSHQVLILQKQYIRGLEEHIRALEMQLSLLRDRNESTHGVVPSQDSEKVEQDKALQKMQTDLKRRESTIEFMTSEQEKLKQKISEMEEAYKSQKSTYLNDILQLQHQIEDLNSTTEEQMKAIQKLESDVEQRNLEIVQLEGNKEELRCQLNHALELTTKYKENIETLEAELTSLRMKTDLMKSSEELESFYRKHKEEIKSLHGKLRAAEQASEHERYMRSKLEEETASLQQKLAELESELSMTQDELEEVRRNRQTLEEMETKIVSEMSDIRSKNQQLKSELEVASISLKTEMEQVKRTNAKAKEEEQRRIREEEKVLELNIKLQDTERKIALSRNENQNLKRETMILREELEESKSQLTMKDSELATLREKVQEMHICVQEFQQHSDATSHLQGQRWRQLLRLADGIQKLGEKAVEEHVK